MPPASKLFQDALELEQQDRAELARLLINSLDLATEQDVEEAWAREIDRRTAELDSGTAETVSWGNRTSTPARIAWLIFP